VKKYQGKGATFPLEWLPPGIAVGLFRI